MRLLRSVGLPLIVAACVTVPLVVVYTARAERKTATTKAADNIGGFLKYWIADGYGTSKPWPPYSGKRFVLSLVTANRIDRRDPKALAFLFSTADPTRSLEEAGGVEAFAGLSKDRLADPAFDVSALTSFVGPRESADFAKSTDERPLIADLHFRDVAIVGLSSGRVKVMTRDDLGLPPDQPITIGIESKSPILRALAE